MPNYQEEPCEVLERKWSAVIVKGEGGAVKMRNTAHMEKLETLPEHLTYRKEDDSGDLENINLPEVETFIPSDRPEPDKPPDSTPPIPRRTEHIRKQPKPFSDYELYCTTMHGAALDSDSDPG